MPKKCKACGSSFRPDPRVPKQQFCSKPECQLQRRKEWQQDKRRSDPHYRENDARQIKEWGNNHPDYWKQYRQQNPDYAERNRNLQKQRNRRQQEMPQTAPLPSGRYQLKLLSGEGIANVYVWIVEITVISRTGS